MVVFELHCYISIGEMPHRDYSCHNLGYFSTIEKVESMIHNEISKENSENIIGFHVNEWAVDYIMKWNQNCNSLSRRSYDRRGKLLAYSPYDTEGKICFKGRDPEECPFQEGDIVEIIGPDCMELSIIAGLPFDHKTMKEFLNERDYDENEFSKYQYGDDCCCTLPVDEDINAHDHTLITSIFPVYEEIPEEYVKHLRSKL